MMKGIKFDDVHSYDDLNLVLSEVSIPPATPKTNFVDIPGGDGSVDLTEALGEVKFEDRECRFTFTVFPYEDFEQKKRIVSNLLNGKRCKITVDKDPGYYWLGRCSVNEYASDKNLHRIVVGAVVAPYKFRTIETSNGAYFCEKNLCRASVTRTSTNHGITLTRNSNSSEVVIDGVCTSEFSMIVADEMLLLPGTYTVSVYGLNDINANSDRCYLYDLDEKSAVVNYIKPGKPGTITITEMKRIRMDVVIAVGSTYSNKTVKFQIEGGNGATQYEPYLINREPHEVILTNGRKTVVPTIICTGETTVTFRGGEIKLNAGTHKLLDLCLREGETPITVTGTDTVAFVYREGDL